ncbi:hypothetical protein QBC40DRAFT_232574 [Triangularia verruculosa]|uniref:Uncharacterized protein n=1 Tax=Triangularia verruculosa TaxID=2587418 RepID=A0AAN6XEP6_9PEZI|nr:hypothetical protein QBC40DRAFT_232574 [Triangularia verruculosa]
MWTSTTRRDESATPSPPSSVPRPPTSSTSFSTSYSSPLSSERSQEQPVYRVYPPPDNHPHHHHHHHHQFESEYCHATRRSSPSPAPGWENGMVDLPYVDYAQVEIQSSSIKVIRSPMSLVRSVASRLPSGPYMLARAVTTYATRSRSASPPVEQTSPVGAAPPLPSRPRIEEGFVTGRERERERLAPPPMMAGRRDGEGLGESESGVNWHFCQQGMTMLHQARQSTSEPELARMLVVNSVSYLNKALPPNLTPAEASTIRQSTPAAVLGPQQQGADYFGHYQGPTRQVQKTMIYHVALVLLNWAAALLQWFVPLASHAIADLARFEKENQYFSKMAMSTLTGMKNAYIWFSGAYAGQLMAAVMGYCFQGVHGAFTEFRSQPVPMRSGGRYQDQQPPMTPEERERRRLYEQVLHQQQQGWTPPNYPTDYSQLQRHL